MKELGIDSGKDIGNIIYKLVESGLIIQESGDSIEHFALIFNENDKVYLFKKYKNYCLYKSLISSLLLLCYSGMMVYISISQSKSLIFILFWILSIGYTFYLYIKQIHT